MISFSFSPDVRTGWTCASRFYVYGIRDKE